MKITAKEGDIFAIPLENKTYAICQIVFLPKGRYKGLFSFIALELNKSRLEWDPTKTEPLTLTVFDKPEKQLFANMHSIKKGTWPIIDHSDLSDELKTLQIYHCAGQLYHGDEYIRLLEDNEYSQYIHLEVSGDKLIELSLMNS